MRRQTYIVGVGSAVAGQPAAKGWAGMGTLIHEQTRITEAAKARRAVFEIDGEPLTYQGAAEDPRNTQNLKVNTLRTRIKRALARGEKVTWEEIQKPRQAFGKPPPPRPANHQWNKTLLVKRGES